jgi:hypothetical protein
MLFHTTSTKNEEKEGVEFKVGWGLLQQAKFDSFQYII